MNWLLTLPLEVRMLAMALLGVLVGTQVNRGIYRLAWFARDIGPWSLPHQQVPARGPYDRFPIVGWWFLSRESPVHGRGFWIRPLLIELGMGIGFALLYWYETVHHGAFRSAGPLYVPSAEVLHLQVFSHLILISLMMVATFIDFDEQTIPDAITIPGTLLGILFATLFPQSRSLVQVPQAVGYGPEFLHITSGTTRPGVPDWPAWLNGHIGLAIGVACFVAWCVAIIPWTWTTRRGLVMAIRFWFASIPRRPSTVPIAIMGAVGSLFIAGIWFVGGGRWESTLSSLVGLAAGGGTIWAVRLVGSAALKQEAMGFGDVTLMAMIGTFTGWQPTLIIFFMAPFSAIVIAVAQYVVSRRHDIAFGPYLCLATLFWIVKSGAIWWEYGRRIFELGWYVPVMVATGLILMGGMLQFWRLIREAFFPWEMEEISAASTGTVKVAVSNVNGSTELPPTQSRASRNHPLRRTICLQPPSSPIPAVRQVGQHPPGRSPLFRR